MNAREFLLTDPKIEEAVSNGYDIRLEEHEWIEKMELYAHAKQNSHKHMELNLQYSTNVQTEPANSLLTTTKSYQKP